MTPADVIVGAACGIVIGRGIGDVACIVADIAGRYRRLKKARLGVAAPAGPESPSSSQETQNS